MSVDLKGNTNYVALRGLPTMVNGEQVPGPYVVPRTNLSAIDMNVANGIETSGDTLGIKLADPLEVISNMHGIGILNADTLATALSFSRGSVLDITELDNIELIGQVPTVVTANGVTTVYGIPATTGGTNKLQIIYQGPLPAVSTQAGLWLVTADVMSIAEDVVQIGMGMGPTTPIDGYSDVSTTSNIWTRVAFLLNTNTNLYDGYLTFYAEYVNATEEESFSFKNVSIVEVSDLEPLYQAELAGVIGTENAYMFKPGKGISIKGNTISMSAEPATVKQVIDGSADALVGNLELTGAVSAGKAVDVTNMPSVTAGTLDTGVSAMQDITWSGTTSGNIGFYDADTKFPAYADGLVYLMLADVTNNGTFNVTITGTNAVNSSMPVVIPPTKTARVAMLFTTAITGYFHAESSGAFDLTFSKLRELEVTGCSEEAREYIARLEDPDNTDDYYLVDQDSVNPWLPMIDMKQSPYTLVQPGLAYKLFANDGEIHTLAVPAIKANTYGRAAYVELFVGSGANIKCQSPLRLADGHSLSDNTLNNCSVKFMDGIATLTVDSTESSYIVTTVEGTTSGTLAYGLSGSTASLIIFNSAVDEEVLNTESATANKSKEIRGNGLDKTTITGNLYPGPNNTISVGNLTLQGCTGNGAIAFIDTVCVINSYQNDGPTAVSDGVTLVVRCSNAGALGGEGSITFGKNTTIDASQNESGGIIFESPVYGGQVIVPSGNTVTFKGLGGYETTITGSKSGTYLLADGSVVNSVYSVSTSSGSANGSFSYGFLNAANNTTRYIVFNSDNTDGTPIELNGTTISSTPTNKKLVTIIGNGPDRTIIGRADWSDQLYMYGKNASLVIKDVKLNASIRNVIGASGGIGTCLLDNVVVDGYTSATSFCGEAAMVGASYTFRNVTLKNMRVTKIPNSSGAGVYGGIRNHVDFIDCVITGNTVTNNNKVTNMLYIYANSTFTNCIIKNNVGALGIYSTSGNTVSVANCDIDGLTNINFGIGGTMTAYQVLAITDTILKNTPIVKTNATPYVKVLFSNTNTFTSTISLNTGTVELASNSVLDMTENANSIVVSNSTVSATAGAQVIPYGETEPVAVEGTGNTLLNNGKLGFLVSNKAATTDANTLYDALVGNGAAYSNVVFDPTVSGDIELGTAVTISRSANIYGNGIGTTVVNCNSNTITAYGGSQWKDCYLSDLTLKNCLLRTGTRGRFNKVTNCHFIQATGPSPIVELSGCTFTNCLPGGNGVVQEPAQPVIDCVFDGTNATGANKYWSSLWLRPNSSKIERCRFVNNILAAGICVYRAGSGTDYVSLTIKDCYFDNRTASIVESSQTDGYKITHLILSGNTIGGEISFGSTATTAPKLEFQDVNIIGSTVFGNVDVVFSTNSESVAPVLDLTNNANATVISAKSISIPNTLKVINTGGSTVTITGPTTGTTLSNQGILS